MAEIVIEAALREAGSSNEARRMRRDRKLPAVVYGGDKESNPITLNPREIVSILKSESGQNTVFQLKLGGGVSETVMIFDVQIDPITHSLVHADLVRIAMDVELEVEIPIELIGEPIGVTLHGGVLDHSLRELTVTCLPGNIPEQIEVDVSELDLHDSIRVADLPIPDNVKVKTDPDRSVASVVAAVTEADLEVDLTVEGEEIEGEVPAEEPEVEGEEPEEGAEKKEEPTE
ncbi:MAG TPA: 50S ribosomal protein L25 [Acidobacteriota bacterium]